MSITDRRDFSPNGNSIQENSGGGEGMRNVTFARKKNKKKEKKEKEMCRSTRSGLRLEGKTMELEFDRD